MRHRVWQQQTTSRMQTVKKVVGILLTVFGVLFLVVCVIFTLAYLRERNGVEGVIGNAGEIAEDQRKDAEDPFAEITAGMSSVMGEVVEAEEGISIRYSVDGNDYFAFLPRIVGDYRAEDQMEVFYDPEDPARNAVPDYFTKYVDSMDRIHIHIVGIAGKLFGIAGAVMLIVGMFLLYRAYSESLHGGR